MIIHDISMPLTNGMLTYPKDVPYSRTLQRDMAQGDSSTVSVMNSSVHVGTHLDAPTHFISDGYNVESIPLDHLYGKAHVIDCRGHEAVTAKVIEKQLPESPERILLKTDNSAEVKKHPNGPFNPKFVYLAGDAAQLLVDRGCKLVGIDYLSIDQSGNPEKASHHILLGNNVTIVEGVMLADIVPGNYFLSCGPLKMEGAEGAPCRAVLIEYPC